MFNWLKKMFKSEPQKDGKRIHEILDCTPEPTIQEPVAETATEPVAETPTEPVVETPTEPVVETPTEPVVEMTEEQKKAEENRLHDLRRQEWLKYN